MSLKIGIVGLPNVGKSTLFQALTRISVPVAPYPFIAVESNVEMIGGAGQGPAVDFTLTIV